MLLEQSYLVYAEFKISNKYRFKIIIKCKNNSEFRALLSKILCEFGKSKEFSGVTAYADMNALVC